MIRETALKRFKRLAASGIVRASASAAMLFGVTLALLPGGGVASAALNSGFTPTSPAGVTVGPDTQNESCPTSFIAGHNVPKLALTETGGTVAAGQTVDYQFSVSQAATASYNARVCVFVADSTGSPITTGNPEIGLAEFDNIPAGGVGSGFTFTYQIPNPIPGTIGSGTGQSYEICSIAKSQEPVNGGGGDRKTNLECTPIPETPTFTTSPSAKSAVTPGTSVTDTATVTGNTVSGAPGGTVNFGLCQETVAGTDCTSSDGGTTVTGGTNVGSAGSITPGTSTGDATSFTSNAVNTGAGLADGTYCFYASFVNSPASAVFYLNVNDDTNPSAECFTVAAPAGPFPTVTTTNLKNAAGVAGSTMQDTATVDGFIIPPPAPPVAMTTGSVTFDLYSDANPFTGGSSCKAQGGTFVSVEGAGESLATGTATSAITDPLPAGNYGFQATFSGSPGFAASPDSVCEPFTIGKADTLTTTTLNAPASATPGSQWSDNASVTLPGPNPLPFQANGTITFTLFNGACNGGTISTSAPIGVTNVADGAGWDATATSPMSSPLPAGSYGYEATYTPTGDTNYNSSTGACEPFTVNEPATTIATSIQSGAGATAPASTQDQATVTTGTGSFAAQAPAGNVKFTLYSSTTPFTNASACDRQAGATVFATAPPNPANPQSVPVGAADVTSATTAVVDSATVTGVGAGNYGWQAIYAGDANYQDSPTGMCEPFTVNAPAPPPAGPAPTGPSVTGTKSSVPPSGSTVAPGTTVVYTMTLTNSGQTQATGMTETDNVPSGTTFVSANNGGTDNSGTVTWSNLNVPAGGSISVSFTVTVNTSDSGITITNVAQFTNVGDPGCTTPTCPTNVVTLSVPKQPVMTAPTSVPPPPTTTTTTVAPTTTTTVAHPALAFTGAYINRVMLAGAAAIGTGLIVFLASSRRRQGTAR